MRVKILRADSVWNLEKEINRFLEKIRDDQIVDIKYQGVGNTPAYSTDRPSAMIIMSDGCYEKNKYWF